MEVEIQSHVRTTVPRFRVYQVGERFDSPSVNPDSTEKRLAELPNSRDWGNADKYTFEEAKLYALAWSGFDTKYPYPLELYNSIVSDKVFTGAFCQMLISTINN